MVTEQKIMLPPMTAYGSIWHQNVHQKCKFSCFILEKAPENENMKIHFPFCCNFSSSIAGTKF